MNSFSNLFYEKIADGLADQGFAVLDNFLSSEEVNAILELDDFKKGITQFQKAGVGIDKQIQEAVRGDYIEWIDQNNAPEALQIFVGRLRELVSSVNRSLFLSLKDFEVHKTIYPAGSFYRRHLDQFKNASHRKLSVICYLNNDWKDSEGGQLRMYLPEGPKDIFPLAGRIVCFRSDQIEHEVLPASRTRLSLTGWILDQLAGLKHL